MGGISPALRDRAGVRCKPDAIFLNDDRKRMFYFPVKLLHERATNPSTTTWLHCHVGLRLHYVWELSCNFVLSLLISLRYHAVDEKNLKPNSLFESCFQITLQITLTSAKDKCCKFYNPAAKIFVQANRTLISQCFFCFVFFEFKKMSFFGVFDKSGKAIWYSRGNGFYQ